MAFGESRMVIVIGPKDRTPEELRNAVLNDDDPEVKSIDDPILCAKLRMCVMLGSLAQAHTGLSGLVRNVATTIVTDRDESSSSTWDAPSLPESSEVSAPQKVKPCGKYSGRRAGNQKKIKHPKARMPHQRGSGNRR